MNNSILKMHNLKPQSFFQKLFKQENEENALIELNNLLASKPIGQIDISEVKELEIKYNLIFIKDFKLNVEEFYAVHLNHFLQAKCISDLQKKLLSELQTLLSIPQNSVNYLSIEISTPIYRHICEAALQNGILTESNKNILKRLATDTNLPNSVCTKILEEESRSFVNSYLNKMVSSQNLSDAEVSKFNIILQNLNIQLDKQSKIRLDSEIKYWKLRNLPLAEISVNGVPATEKCYYSAFNVSWQETRKQKIGHGRGSYSIDQWTEIARGVLYITNKNVRLLGSVNKTIKLLDISSFSTSGNSGIEIRKITGRNANLILIGADIKEVAIILERLRN